MRLLAFVVTALTAACMQTAPLREAPSDREIREGKVVLVDDGTCPAGEIKQITGGNQSKGIPRISKCIPRSN